MGFYPLVFHTDVAEATFIDGFWRLIMIGRVIEGFQILEKLGEGGMGEVYRATDTSLGRIVALKALHSDLTKDPQLTERFLSEARTQAQLNHPNLATLYRLFQFEGSYYMVMEYIHGETFAQMVRREGPIQQERAIPLFKQALAGLAHAHHAGIIHRDIKPSNMMVNKDGIVKVMDFGIAKILGGRGLTATGVRLGTLYYMSPEQIRNQPLDIRTDIYALGITLYEMLTGRVPFDSNSDYDLMQQHIQQPPPLLRQFFPYLSPGVEAAVLQALEKDPNRRFQTVEAFSRALDEAMAATPRAPRSTGVAPVGGVSQSEHPQPKTTPLPTVASHPTVASPRVSTPIPDTTVVAPRTPLPTPRERPQTPLPRVSTPVPDATVIAPRTPVPSSSGFTTPRVSTPVPGATMVSPQTPVPPSGGYPADARMGWPPSTPVSGVPLPPPMDQVPPGAPGKSNNTPIVLGVVGVLLAVVVAFYFVAKSYFTRTKPETAPSAASAQITTSTPPPTNPTPPTATPASTMPASTQPSGTEVAQSSSPAPQVAEITKPSEPKPEEPKRPREGRKSQGGAAKSSAQNQTPALTAAQQALIQQQIEMERQRLLQQQMEQQQKANPQPVAPPPKPPAETKPEGFSYRVAHDHGQGFQQNCMGTLVFTKTRISYKPDSGPHGFDVAFEDVKEIKKNSGFFSSVPSFHVKLKNGENYNLARIGSDRRVMPPSEILTQLNEVIPPGVKH